MDTSKIKAFITLKKAAYALVAVGMFLLPMFFLPWQPLTPIFAKVVILYGVVFLAFVLYLVSILKSGYLNVPWHPVFIAALVVPIVMVVSAFGAPILSQSLVGYGYEISTVLAASVFVITLLLTTLLFRSSTKVFNAYILFLVSALILGVYHVVRLIFGPELVSFNHLNSVVSSTVGSFNDLGIFFGAALVLSVLLLEMLPLHKYLRAAVYTVAGLSLFMMVIINFNVVWVAVGILSIIYVVYDISWKTRKEGVKRNASYRSIAVLVVAVLMLLPVGGYVENLVSEKLGIANVDARPSATETLAITKNVWQEDPLIGSGPNTFSYEWLENKPVSVNVGPFWNINFNYGFGLLPTIMTTTGVLGALAWLLFLGLFVYIGLKAIFRPQANPLSAFVSVSSFIVAIYFWAMMVFYVPSITNVALGFFFTGLFLASAATDKVFVVKRLELFNKSIVSFISVLILIVAIIFTVTAGYAVGTRVASSVYFQKALIAANQQGDINQAEEYLTRAIEVKEQDIYHRTLSELYLVRLNDIASNINADNISEEDRFNFQQALGAADKAAVRAKDINPTNFENWVALGRVYGTILPLGFAQAYDNAVGAFSEAQKLNPKSPSLYLVLARLELANDDTESAKELINKAIELKPNYAEAIFILSQIQVSEGDIQAAISSVERAAQVSPNDPGIFFQLGLLHYNDENYEAAIPALERAVRLVPQYSNAMYFLGLSYDKIDRTEEAILLFERIKQLNPDNEEVDLILGNLRDGRDPFNEAPEDLEEPENRENLPIEE